tara:strand:- start:221 stop:346 length:126 start_codon:yes stop_codon:yes gene_type:complete
MANLIVEAKKLIRLGVLNRLPPKYFGFVKYLDGFVNNPSSI